MPSKKKIDLPTARRLAVAGSVDPRSIRKEYACPGSVVGMAGERARKALTEAGFLRAPSEPKPAE